MKVISNYHVRDVVDASQLPPEAREEFDYLDWDAFERGEDSRSFVRYRGNWIDLGDVERAPHDIARLGFDGFNPDSYFSGVAFRYFDEDGHEYDNSVIVATILV